MDVSRGSCFGRVLWRLHMPHPMLAMPSHVNPYPHGFSSKCCNTPSTNQLHVFSFQAGRSVLVNKDYCLNSSSSSKICAWNLLDFDTQSAAIACVDTIKYYFHSKRSKPFRGSQDTTSDMFVPLVNPVCLVYQYLVPLVQNIRTVCIQ